MTTWSALLTLNNWRLQGRTRRWSSREDEVQEYFGKSATPDKMDKALAQGEFATEKTGEELGTLYLPRKHESTLSQVLHHRTSYPDGRSAPASVAAGAK